MYFVMESMLRYTKTDHRWHVWLGVVYYLALLYAGCMGHGNLFEIVIREY